MGSERVMEEEEEEEEELLLISLEARIRAKDGGEVDSTTGWWGGAGRPSVKF